MSRDDVAVLAGWAADEGWNPGNADIGIAWDIDPGAFIALHRDGELVGGGTIFRHSPMFGFMGLFIVKAGLRRAGLGAPLWHHRLDLLQTRLAPGATIGMDGVFDMVPFYTRGGFTLAYRDLRFQGAAQGVPDKAVRPLTEADFPAIEAIDRQHFPTPRGTFLRRWVFQPGAHALGLFDSGTLLGFGVARPARQGFKLGPVYAMSPDSAESLVSSLMAPIIGQQVQLDVPEPNDAGLRLAQSFGLSEVFGCARMYHGPTPDLPVRQIFGVTSFEFG
ncbi:MAG: GNAT family N-acetyltransferase [Proteobacteria bacterium]|nr:GNAT family N-acetyltransferase [Pseudomonadota bacterium]